MPSMKGIKRRKASVSNTKQIMKAMNLVAASRLQKAKTRLNAVRMMFEETKRIMNSIKGGADSVFFNAREVKNTAYIIITSDRGLCGGYNANISKAALSHMQAGKSEKIIMVGVKGWEYFKRRGKNLLIKHVNVSGATFFENAERLAGQVIALYTSGEVDEVYLAYTYYASTLSHVPRVEKILPVGGSTPAMPDSGNSPYDPDIGTFLEHTIPMYLGVLINGAMAESAVCEYAARMTSMDAAANNATEIIEKLTLEYNRKRQGIITQEINEIVSGANALQ